MADLTEDQLDRRIQVICENPDDAEAAEPELTDWQHRLSEINRAA